MRSRPNGRCRLSFGPKAGEAAFSCHGRDFRAGGLFQSTPPCYLPVDDAGFGGNRRGGVYKLCYCNLEAFRANASAAATLCSRTLDSCKLVRFQLWMCKVCIRLQGRCGPP